MPKNNGNKEKKKNFDFRDEWSEPFDLWKKDKVELKEQIKKAEEAIAKEIKSEVIKVEEAAEKFIKPRKSLIISVGIIIILLTIGLIVYFNYDPLTIRQKPLDIEARNSSWLPVTVYYNGATLFSLSGWESKLSYGNEEGRIYGNEQYRKIVFDNNGR